MFNPQVSSRMWRSWGGLPLIKDLILNLSVQKRSGAVLEFSHTKLLQLPGQTKGVNRVNGECHTMCVRLLL